MEGRERKTAPAGLLKQKGTPVGEDPALRLPEKIEWVTTCFLRSQSVDVSCAVS